MPFFGGYANVFSTQVLDFVRSVVSNFTIGPNNTRVSVATFATNVNVNFFTRFNDKASLLAGINSADIPYPTRGTRTSLGLSTVRVTFCSTYLF